MIPPGTRDRPTSEPTARPYTFTPDELSSLLAAQSRLADALARPAEISRFHLQVVEEASRLLNGDSSLLCRLDPADTQILRVTAGAGPLARLEGALLPVQGSFEGHAFTAPHPVETPNLSVSGQFFRTPEHRRYVGPAIALGFRGIDQRSGVLLVARRPGAARFDTRDVRLLRQLEPLLVAGTNMAAELELARGGRDALVAWRVEHSGREWLRFYYALASERREVAFRIDNGGRIHWADNLHSVFDQLDEPFASSVDQLLTRLEVDDRVLVRSALRQILKEAGASRMTVACVVDLGDERKAPVRLNVWKGTAATEVMGVLTATDREVTVDPAGGAPSRTLEQRENTGGPDDRHTRTAPAVHTGTESPETIISSVAETDRPVPREASAPLPSLLTDLHCHLLPAVDDGAEDEDQALASLATAYASGVRQLVVTPHVQISTLRDPARGAELRARIDTGWEKLETLGSRQFPDLQLHRGSELMIDDPRPGPLPDWLRLGANRYLLVEFPGMWFPPRYCEVLSGISAGGFTPLLAHPERYQNLEITDGSASAWRGAGVRLQVNCGSVLGQYGPVVRDRAWRLLEQGLASCLASDYHARGNYPIAECLQLLDSVGGAGAAHLLLHTNPSRILAGLHPLDVPPLKQPDTFLQRIARTRLFGR